MFEESVGSPDTRPPDLLGRLTPPVVGLGLALALTAMTFFAAVDLANGRALQTHAYRRGYVLRALTYELAQILGVRGTLAVGTIVVAIQIVLVGRAIREPK